MDLKIAHMHFDGANGDFTLTLNNGRSEIYQQEPHDNRHAFGDICATGANACEDDKLRLARQPFRMANDTRPRFMEDLCPRKLLSVRQLHFASLTGLTFSHKFLLIVGISTADVVYPPIVTERMVVDMSCHLWAMWRWFDSSKKSLDHRLLEYSSGCLSFASYLLEKANIEGATDWPLQYIIYKNPASTTGQFWWIRIQDDERAYQDGDSNYPLAPMSTEHTSQTKADKAYHKYLAGKNHKIMPLSV